MFYFILGTKKVKSGIFLVASPLSPPPLSGRAIKRLPLGKKHFAYFFNVVVDGHHAVVNFRGGIHITVL